MGLNYSHPAQLLLICNLSHQFKANLHTGTRFNFQIIYRFNIHRENTHEYAKITIQSC